MPVNLSLIKKLRSRYGAKKGTSVYFGLENKGSKAFKKGVKTAQKEGHTVPHLKDMDKARKSMPKSVSARIEANKMHRQMDGIRSEMAKRMGRGKKKVRR